MNYVPELVLHLQQSSFCLSFLSIRFIGMYHHTWFIDLKKRKRQKSSSEPVRTTALANENIICRLATNHLSYKFHRRIATAGNGLSWDHFIVEGVKEPAIGLA